MKNSIFFFQNRKIMTQMRENKLKRDKNNIRIMTKKTKKNILVKK